LETRELKLSMWKRGWRRYRNYPEPQPGSGGSGEGGASFTAATYRARALPRLKPDGQEPHSITTTFTAGAPSTSNMPRQGWAGNCLLPTSPDSRHAFAAKDVRLSTNYHMCLSRRKLTHRQCGPGLLHQPNFARIFHCLPHPI